MAMAAVAAHGVDSLPLAFSNYHSSRSPQSQSRPSLSCIPSQGGRIFSIVSRFSPILILHPRKRGHPICAESSNTEKAFQTAVELDRFIDELRQANPQEGSQDMYIGFVAFQFNRCYQQPIQGACSALGHSSLFAQLPCLSDIFLPLLVAKNVLAFDTPFWMRLAARADICVSSDDKKNYEELATSIMTLVERVIRKTQEKIESSTDVLKSILKPITVQDEEIVWPPQDPNRIAEMKKEVERKEQQGFLDEGFLSEVSAQIRQAREDGDKPGLVAILQKVLQLYAAQILLKRSYAVKDGQVDKAEEFLEAIISADEERWAEILRTGMVYGGGQVEPEELYQVVNKRVERVSMRTESGSYQQRIVVEYLKEIEERAKAIVEAFQGSAT